MRILFVIIFIVLFSGCSKSTLDVKSNYFIDFEKVNVINNNQIAFYLNYNIPSSYFEENQFFILSWNKIGGKGDWNGFISDTIITQSGKAEKILDLYKINPDLKKGDTLEFFFSLERKESEFSTVQITKSSRIIFTSK